MADTLTIHPDSTEYTASHLIYDGDGAWIEAKRVWVEFPWPEVDGVEDEWGWQFNTVEDLIRWLHAPGDD